MGLRRGFILLVALFASSALGAPRDFSKVRCEATPLANGLRMLRWTGVNFAVGNMVISVGGDGALVVDNGFPELADQLKAAVAELGPQPIRLVLNTHPHFDHLDGNEWLARSGTLIIAHERSRARLLEPQCLPEFNATFVIAPYPAAALPVVTCGESLTLHFNGDEVRLIHVPNAHSDGDLIIQFAKANVLHAGDLFVPDAIPFIAFSGGGSLDGMIRAAERILDLCDANTRVVPGHGPASNREAVRAQRNLLVAIRDRLTQAIVAGRTVDEVVAANLFADLYQGRQPYLRPEALARYGYLDVQRSLQTRR